MFVKELVENNNKIYEKTKRIKQLSANALGVLGEYGVIESHMGQH